MNEARAAFVKLKAEYKKSFLNEGASEPSKKEVKSEKEDEKEEPQKEDKKEDKPEKKEKKEVKESFNAIDKLYKYAIESASSTTEITGIKTAQNESVKYFGIIDLLGKVEPIAVYEYGDKVYYGNYDDLNEMLEGIIEGVYEEKDLELLEGEEPQCVSSALLEDGYELIDTLLLESVKIKKPGLSTNGDIKLSKKMADIVNGTKDRRDFEKKVERETQQAGVDNPLAMAPQAQQESVNVEDGKVLSESYIDKNNIEIIYEPEDWVIIKENGMKAQVINVVNDGDGNLTMLTILASNGISYDASPEEIEPDPAYLANIPGRTINSTLLGVPRLATFGINPKTKLTDIVNNDDPALEAEYKDFNDKR